MRFGPVSRGRLVFTVDSGGRPEEFALVVPRDGRRLAGIAAAGNWPGIVPGLLDGESRERWMAMLADPVGPVGWRATWQVAIDTAPELYGVPWWAAGRLCATAAAHWRDWEAWTVTQGVDVTRAPAHRICAAALAWLRAGCKEERDFARLEHEIFTPPPEMRRLGARPPGFSAEELARQAAELAALDDS